MAENQVLIIVWPHEQYPAEGVEPERPPARPAGTGREDRPSRLNQVWEAVAAAIDVPPSSRGRSWDTGFGEVLAALQLQEMIVDAANNFRQPRPNLRERRWGRIHERSGDDRVVLRSDLALKNDGSSVPAVRMIQRLLVERKPRLVVSIGIGGGVGPADRVGDVVVATRAQFELRGSLEDIELNGQAHGGTATVAQDWFNDIDLPKARELPLLPTSDAFIKPEGGWPPPRELEPQVRVDTRHPVMTRPSLSEPLFVAAALEPRMRNNPYLGDDAAAVDMDAAVPALACATADPQVPFVAIIGVAVPALGEQPNDWERNVRDAWTETYHREFSAVAAQNAVTVMNRLIERMPS